MQNQKATKFRRYTFALLTIIAVITVAFFTYLGFAHPDYSGRYQADCREPSCSFELYLVTSKEYLLTYLGEEVRMMRFIDPSDKTYLLNTSAITGTPFTIASIWLDGLETGHTQWQGRTYYKIGNYPKTTDHSLQD
ncbi:hypothetical protein KRX19_03285 [Cardiobacteriaceae bacterium TAE3-ERU3]|nr:hypothetical protein [Cardiobacteriaceae bacterium TAE3-ERU3]